MKNNSTIFKPFLFGLAILSSSFLFSMEESLTLKGYINLSDKPCSLHIGGLIKPKLFIGLQPKEGKLTNHTLNYKDGKWESFVISANEIAHSFKPTGKHPNFVIVQTDRYPGGFEEIPVS